MIKTGTIPTVIVAAVCLITIGYTYAKLMGAVMVNREATMTNRAINGEATERIIARLKAIEATRFTNEDGKRMQKQIDELRK